MLGLEIQEARSQGHPDDAVLGYVAQRDPQLAAEIQAAMQAGHAPGQVLDYLQQKLAPTRTEMLTRGAGLTARAGAPIAAGAALGAAMGAPIGGVGAIPGAAVGAVAAGFAPILADPLVALYNKTTGSNITSPTQAMEEMLTKYGLPSPITSTDRIAVAGARGMAGGAGGAAAAGRAAQLQPVGTTSRVVLEGLGKAPVAQGGAGAAASMAGQAVAEGGGSPAAQMGAALGVGMLTPSGGSVARGAARGAPALVSPFSQRGREAIVGGVLRRLATDPDAAAERMRNYQPPLPGARATMGGASRDPGLMGAEGPIISAFDTTRRVADRVSQNNDARIGAIDRIARDETAIDYARNKRTAVTRPMREDAFANADPSVDIQGPVRAEIDRIMAGNRGAGEATQNAMRWLTGRLDAAGTDAARLYEVRKDLANAASGRLEKQYPGLQTAGGALLDVQRTLDAALERAAPGYADYMSQFRRSSLPIDQMRLLQGLRDDSLTGLKNPQSGLNVIAAGTWTKNLRSAATEIGETLSPTQQRILSRISQDIDDGVAPQTSGRTAGSDTIKNMSVANLIGRVFGESVATNTTLQTLGRPLQWLYKLPEPKLQELLMDAMLDPKLAADLMARASVVRVAPAADRLRQRAIDLGMGSYIGAAEAEARRTGGK